MASRGEFIAQLGSFLGFRRQASYLLAVTTIMPQNAYKTWPQAPPSSYQPSPISFLHSRSLLQVSHIFVTPPSFAMLLRRSYLDAALVLASFSAFNFPTGVDAAVPPRQATSATATTTTSKATSGTTSSTTSSSATTTSSAAASTVTNNQGALG